MVLFHPDANFRADSIEHFEAARNLVPVAQCSRSLAAVQTVLCQCLYLKSMHDQRATHTYVSIAGYAAYVIPAQNSQQRYLSSTVSMPEELLLQGLVGCTDLSYLCRHQLGLHKAASARHLPEKIRATAQRVYNAIRIFDAYTTCSLGLPRTFRGTGQSTPSLDAPFIAESGMLHATDANLELLDILGSDLEKMCLSNATTEGKDPTAAELEWSGDLSRELLQWDLKYPIFAHIPENERPSRTEHHTQ